MALTYSLSPYWAPWYLVPLGTINQGSMPTKHIGIHHIATTGDRQDLLTAYSLNFPPRPIQQVARSVPPEKPNDSGDAMRHNHDSAVTRYENFSQRAASNRSACLISVGRPLPTDAPKGVSAILRIGSRNSPKGHCPVYRIRIGNPSIRCVPLHSVGTGPSGSRGSPHR